MRFMVAMGLPFLFVVNIAYAQNPTDDYPPAPHGIYWGWQDNVLFGFDKAGLSQKAKSTLDRIAVMMENREVNLLITGHTDNIGNLAYNRTLSERRVQAVVDYMKENGIGRNRIVTRNTGEQRPVANNACPEDRKRNRRADLAFFPAGYLPPPVNKKLFTESQPEVGECEQAIEDARHY